jgi:hypothetical protein
LRKSIAELFVRSAFKRTAAPKNSTPSTTAGSSGYFANQSSDDAILDSRRAATAFINTVAPPIQLFNPAFAYFSSKASDSTYNVPPDFVSKVVKFMYNIALIYSSEVDRRDAIGPYLEKVIGRPLTIMNNADRTTPDFAVLSSVDHHPLYLVVGEEKNELGNGGSDPSTQAALSYSRICSQVKVKPFCFAIFFIVANACRTQNRELLLKTSCPAFIVAHAGAWLTIMGGVTTANTVVQRLTDYLWIPVHSSLDEAHCFKIARILYALKESIDHLHVWYQTQFSAEPYNTNLPRPHPRFYPTPTTYSGKGARFEFTYEQPLQHNVSCVTYLAKTIEEHPRRIVVKYVTAYGEKAHQVMAAAGYAPELLYFGPLPAAMTDGEELYGDFRMVVMDYVDGLTYGEALKGKKVPAGFQSHLRDAVDHLHAAGYVFGDLRHPNVMVAPDEQHKAKLIDFDWAGSEGTVRYPALISDLGWSEGIQGLALITKEHDDAMFEHFMADES